MTSMTGPIRSTFTRLPRARSRSGRFPDPDGGNLALASRVGSLAMGRMWDARGFFHYRVLRSLRIRTPYMRWSQAWMLLALASLRTHPARFHGEPVIERQATPC